jgi:arylformamidase
MSHNEIWLGFNQQALDAEYDNQRTVLDYGAVIREWEEASAAARAACSVQSDLVYGSHPRAKLDFYPASGDGCIIFFHGGFWRSFDKTGITFLAPAFTAAGISIALPNYPLAPNDDMETIVRHACMAVDWVVDRASDLQLDGSKLWVGGHSAGAHLAMMAAVASKAKDKIAGWCAVSGIYDLAPIQLSYLNQSLNLSEADVASFSPIRSGARRAGLIAAVGSRETREFRRQTEAFVEHCSGRGAEVEYHVLPETDHYEAVRSLGRPGNALFGQVASAINKAGPA